MLLITSDPSAIKESGLRGCAGKLAPCAQKWVFKNPYIPHCHSPLQLHCSKWTSKFPDQTLHVPQVFPQSKHLCSYFFWQDSTDGLKMISISLVKVSLKKQIRLLTALCSGCLLGSHHNRMKPQISRAEGRAREKTAEERGVTEAHDCFLSTTTDLLWARPCARHCGCIKHCCGPALPSRVTQPGGRGKQGTVGNNKEPTSTHSVPLPPPTTSTHSLPHFCLCLQSGVRRISPGRWQSLPGTVEGGSAAKCFPGAHSPSCGAGANTFCLWLFLLNTCIPENLSGGVFQEPSPLLTSLWTKCVCGCVSFLSTEPTLLVQLPKLSAKSRCLIRPRSWGWEEEGGEKEK